MMADAVTTTLDRIQFIDRLLHLQFFVRREADAYCGALDERVPAEQFDEFRTLGLVEEVVSGQWMISGKGRQRFRRR